MSYFFVSACDGCGTPHPDYWIHASSGAEAKLCTSCFAQGGRLVWTR